MATREVELLHDGTDKRFVGVVEGTTLTTRVGSSEKAGRTTRRSFPTEAEAMAALHDAVAKKVKEGYFPLGEGYSPPVLADFVDEPGETTLRFRAAPKERGGYTVNVRNTPPPQLDKARSGWGFHYKSGPGEYGLWLPDRRLAVGKRHAVRPVSPALEGDSKAFITWHGLTQPFRPDGLAMLLIHGKVLYEIDLPEARATPVHTFADGLPKHLVYGADHAALWLDGATVVRAAVGESSAPVFEADAPLIDLRCLRSGALALLTHDTLLRVAPADGYRVTYELPCRNARALGVLLDGRVLAVGSKAYVDTPTTFLAEGDDGAWRLMTRTKLSISAAYDLYGAQWMNASGSDTHRIINVRAAWEAARSSEPIADDFVVVRCPLQDLLQTMLHEGGRVDRARLERAVRRDPALLELPDAQRTPLAFAAYRGSREAVDALVALGASLDSVGEDGKSALYHALEHGHQEVAAALLDQGARADAGAGALSPLIAAAARGYHTLAARLLDAGADPKGRGPDDICAAGAALAGQHLDLARWLLDHGVAPGGRASIKAAMGCTDIALTRRMLSGNPAMQGPDIPDLFTYALLSVSVGSMPREVIDVFLDEGVVKQTAEALLRAVACAHPRAVRALLAAGVDPQAPHFTANKPELALSVALFTQTPDLDTIAALLDGGADIDGVDRRGTRPLNYAIQNGPLDVVRALIDRGASVRGRGAARWAPVHQAVYVERLDVLDLLLAHGADLNETTAHGISALSLAIFNAKAQAVTWLLDHDADPDAGDFTALMTAAIKGDVPNVRRLLSLGADTGKRAVNPFDNTDDQPRTAQGHAERLPNRDGCPEAATLLSEASGAGYQSVHAAISNGAYDVAEAMLDGGVTSTRRVRSARCARSMSPRPARCAWWRA